jgi:hypothetical protein
MTETNNNFTESFTYKPAVGERSCKTLLSTNIAHESTRTIITSQTQGVLDVTITCKLQGMRQVVKSTHK